MFIFGVDFSPQHWQESFSQWLHKLEAEIVAPTHTSHACKALKGADPSTRTHLPKQSLARGVIFDIRTLLPVLFFFLPKKLSLICVDRAPTRTTNSFVHVQLITARSAQRFHSSRNTRGASRLLRMFPHLPRNTSTRSLSPASPVFRPSSPSLSCPTSAHSGLDQETLRD